MPEFYVTEEEISNNKCIIFELEKSILNKNFNKIKLYEIKADAYSIK